jgi:hypothetical protein
VEKMAVVRKAVPIPSVTLNKALTSTKAHLEIIKFTNLKIMIWLSKMTTNNMHIASDALHNAKNVMWWEMLQWLSSYPCMGILF